MLLKGTPQYMQAENTYGTPKQAPFKSGLVQMEYEAESVIENRQIELFW